MAPPLRPPAYAWSEELGEVLGNVGAAAPARPQARLLEASGERAPRRPAPSSLEVWECQLEAWEEPDESAPLRPSREPFQAAVRAGDHVAISAQLRGRSELASEPFPGEEAPLILAAEILVERVRDAGSQRPGDMCKIVGLLLEHRADPNTAAPPVSETALQILVFAGDLGRSQGPQTRMRRWAQTQACAALLEARADPNQADDLGQGPLLAEAVCEGDAEMSRLLLSHGALPLLKGGKGLCAIDLAPTESMRTYLEDVASRQAAEQRALQVRADRHFRQEDFQRAAELYGEAILLGIFHAGLRASRAAALMSLGELERALEDAEAVLEREPEHLRAGAVLATCHLFLDRPEEAAETCERLAQLARPEGEGSLEPDRPEWTAFLQTKGLIGKLRGKVQRVEEVLVDSGKAQLPVAEDCLRVLADVMNALTDVQYASVWGRRLRLTRVRVLLFPLPGKSGQARATRSAWESEASKETLSLAAAGAPDPDLLHWRARCVLREGRWDEARSLLRRAAEEHGGAASAELLEDLRRVKEEIELAAKALQREELDAALRHYDAAVEADRVQADAGFSASLLLGRGTVLRQLEQVAAALEDVQQALAIRPACAEALFCRGRIFIDLGRYADASDDLDRAAKLAPALEGLKEWQAKARRWRLRPPQKDRCGRSANP